MLDVPAYVHLLRAKDLADRAYAEPLDVPALAAAALCSEAHFIRSFKRAFGETPARYLQRRRLERAAELLRGTDLPVTEVCLAVGFRSLGSFTTAFGRALGASPTAYREAESEAAAGGTGADQIPGCFGLMWTRPVGT